MSFFKKIFKAKEKEEKREKLIDVDNLDMLDNFKPQTNSKFGLIFTIIIISGLTVWYVKYPNVLDFKNLITNYGTIPLNNGFKIGFEKSKDYIASVINKNPTKTEPLMNEDKINKTADIKTIINQMKEKEQYTPMNQVQVTPVVAQTTIEIKNKEILNSLTPTKDQPIENIKTSILPQVSNNIDVQNLKSELQKNNEAYKKLLIEQEVLNQKISGLNNGSFKKEDIENLIYVNNQELSKVLNEKIIPIIKVMNDDILDLKKINSKKDTQIKVLKKMLNLNNINDESMYEKTAIVNNEIGLDYYGAKLVNEKNGNLIVMGFITKQDKSKVFEVFINAEIENSKIGDIKIIDITESYIYIQSKSNNQIYKIKKI